MTQSDEREREDHADAIEPSEETPPRTGHEGSAPPQLSGGGLLATWVTSIAVHVAFFVVMFLIPWLSTAADRNPDIPLPNARLIGEVEQASFSPSEVLDLSANLNVTEPQKVRFDPKQFEGLSELDQRSKPELSVIGIGAGGGDFSKFGVHVAGGAGPEFFGLGKSATGARRVVFVVDRSGSMTDTFDFVRAELKRSISAMRRSQKFHVIFFSSGKPVENAPRRPVSAIRAQKSKFFEFLDSVFTAGRTDPAPAMIRAFDCEPDMIYFLTDGEFDRALIGRLDKLNKGRKVRIFTIAYFNESGAELLQTIAREHRGEFTFVTEDDLP